MPKSVLVIVCLLAPSVPAAFAGVTVSTPSNGVTVAGSVPYVATASTSCSKGVASMGIYSAPGVLAYVVNGASLNTSLSLSPGSYNTAVQSWDYCGNSASVPIAVTVTSKTGVFVTSPANNSTVNSPASFVASATSTCSKGVAAMGIYSAPGQLAYTVPGASLNYGLGLSAGKYNAVVQEWDYCGGSSTAPVTFTVAASNGNSFTNLQHSSGWSSYGQGPPNYVDCNPCSSLSWSMTQNVKSGSLSGEATDYAINSGANYWDVLFNNHLIGDLSSQGLPDTNHTLVPTLHDFTYDVYFYGANLALSQAIEFDVNQFFDGMGFIFGHECRIAGGNEWDVFDNATGHWVPTGIACNPVSNSWNHVTIKVQRNSSNQLVYQSITLNGVTGTLNWTYSPGSAPGWWGITINYQMDGNYKENPYTVMLDELTFSYQ